MDKGKLNLPFALKYRPSRFADVVGNELLVKVVQVSVVKEDLSNAYFFCGTRGSGKTSLARIFAMAINCQNRSVEGEPCCTCDICKDIVKQINPDVIEIDAASQNSVDSIRRLKTSLTYRPLHAKYKVVIIDECHSLTSQAANALLKTLEEPPEYVVFVFCTTEPEKVLDTIRSRCLVFRFKNIESVDIVTRLGSICKQERLEADQDALAFIARYAKGGMRDAVSLLDQLSRHETKITMPFIRQALNLINELDIIEFISLVVDSKEREAIEKAMFLAEDKPVLDFVVGITEILEQVYLIKLGLLPVKEQEKLGVLASKLLGDKILDMVTAIKKICKDAKYFYLLSQKSTILHIVSSLCSLMRGKEQLNSSLSTTIVMGASARINTIEKVFDSFRDISEDRELLTRFGLNSAKV